jgi:glycosyltransferase involved in cell wall biosynthesis
VEIRVAHVISGLRVGGAERHLVNLLNTLSCDYKSCIFVGAQPEGPTFHDDLDSDIEQYQVRIRRRNLPVGIARLATLLKKAKINVVHTHMYASNLYGSLAAALAGVPVVVTSEHGENPWKRSYQRLIERYVISTIADARFCVSPRILEIRRDRDGVPDSKLKLMVNGTVLPKKKASDSANPVPVIGAVGRFIPAKDYPCLLHAVAELRSRGHEFQLYILGDGPDFASVQDLVTDLGLESIVSLPGMVSDMESWYRRCDIYVISSMREGLPVALLEAMAHRLPVIATDVGAIAETVRDGEGGLIVPPGEPESIANALARLLDDPDLRDRLGKGAHRRIKDHYSVDKVAQLHEATYRQLLVGKKAG